MKAYNPFKNTPLFFFMISAFILTVSIVIVPSIVTQAEIAEGTYEINYEMKEASSENTSIADGFFEKPATLTVENDEKHIELMVTSSSMIQSLSTPTGEVDIVEEDEENEERIVKFRVDQDLSEPLEMEMHVIVPDLYDMKHTARAVFDVDELYTAEGDSNEEDNTEEVSEEPENNADETSEVNDVNEMSENNENEEEASANENADEKNDTSNVWWITLVIVGIVIIVVIVFGIFRKQRSK